MITERDLQRLAEEDLQPDSYEEPDHLEEAKYLLFEIGQFFENGLGRSNLSSRALTKMRKLAREIDDFLSQWE